MSARNPVASTAYQEEFNEKFARGQAKVFIWEDIKDNSPKQLKVSPLVMVSHKYRLFCAILDLSFSLRVNTPCTLSA